MQPVFKTLLLIIVTAFFVSSCGNSNYYQKQTGIPNAAWESNFKPVFDLNIPDSNHRYITYVILRHSDDYPFSNLWLELKFKGPKDKVFSKGYKLELTLADLAGKWLARGSSGIWEHRIPIRLSNTEIFTSPGDYKIQLAQIMRQDPLLSVINIGVRVEKIPLAITNKATTADSAK